MMLHQRILPRIVYIPVTIRFRHRPLGFRHPDCPSPFRRNREIPVNIPTSPPFRFRIHRSHPMPFHQHRRQSVSVPPLLQFPHPHLHAPMRLCQAFHRQQPASHQGAGRSPSQRQQPDSFPHHAQHRLPGSEAIQRLPLGSFQREKSLFPLRTLPKPCSQQVYQGTV